MAYLTSTDRTALLLELIEDCELQRVEPSEALKIITAAAKRHPDWPETAKERTRKYQEQEEQKKARADTAKATPEAEVM